MTPASLFIPKVHTQLALMQDLLLDDDLKTYHPALDFCCRWLQRQSTFIFLTSGSTGLPKEIRISREKMQLSAQNTLTYLRLPTDCTALLCMEATMIGGAMLLVRACIGRMNLLLVPPSRNPLQSVDRTVDFTAMVPLQWKTTLATSPKKIAEVLHERSVVLLGGGALDVYIEQLTLQHRVRAFATFGMTETVSHVAIRALSESPEQNYFEALGDVNFALSDRHTLQVKGAITDHQWLVTNDHAEVLSPTTFKWLGRSDFVINTGGVKVHPEALENQLAPVMADLGFHFSFFVGGIEDTTYGQVVTLFAEGSKNINEKTLLSQLKQQLPHISSRHLPKKLQNIEKFIYTPGGKINRLATLQFFNNNK